MPESAPPRRFAALDGLRGIAVILVLVMHYYVAVPTLEGGAWHDGLKRAFSLSFCGVGLFFVLCPLLRVTALLHGENPLAAVFLLPMRAEGLLGGVLCAIALRDARILDVLRAHCRLIGWLIAALGAFLALFCSLNLRAGSALMASFGYSIVSLFFVGVVLWVMLFPEGKAARALSLKPLCAMGLISYFIYLFHNPALYALHGLIRHQPAMHFNGTGVGVPLLALALTVVLGGLSWRLFESPLVKLGRQRGYR